MVKDGGAKECQAGGVINKTHFTNQEIGCTRIGIGLVEVEIGGCRNALVHNGTI